MSTLYLDRRDLRVDLTGKALTLRVPDERPRSVPLALIERVVITGASTKLTSGTLLALAQRGISTILLPTRSARNAVSLHGPRHNDAAIRLGQSLRIHDPEHVRNLAHAIVQAKLVHQNRTLDHLMRQRPDLRRPLHHGHQQLTNMVQSLDDQTNLPDLPRLRGIEGAAARCYFKAIAPAFPPELQFTGRNRRPPRDPVNALLSLSYTMIHQHAVQALHAAGLDPHLGFYHQPSFARESLASDFIEPLRPRIDLWVQRLLADRYLRAEHFHRDQGACLLGKAGRGLYFAAWETRAKALRRLLRINARQMARQLEPIGAQHFINDDTDEPEDVA